MRIELLKGIETLEELKAAYRKLAFKYHPDKATGSVELMQKLNAEYDYLSKELLNQFGKHETIEESEEFKIVIEELNKIFEGLNQFTIELRGSWFWIWGIGKEDKEIKDKIKKLGFFFTREGKGEVLNVWRRKPIEDKKRRTKSMGMDYINKTFETTTIKTGTKTYKKQLAY